LDRLKDLIIDFVSVTWSNKNWGQSCINVIVVIAKCKLMQLK